MIKLTISGYKDPSRSVELLLPATEEQERQAFDKLTGGLPIGVTFAYQITAAAGDCPQALARIRYNSSVDEINLLSYMLENISADLRDRALQIAGCQAEPGNLRAFINEVAAVKNGSKPDVYQGRSLRDWLASERREYEQRQDLEADQAQQMGHMTM